MAASSGPAVAKLMDSGYGKAETELPIDINYQKLTEWLVGERLTDQASLGTRQRLEGRVLLGRFAATATSAPQWRAAASALHQRPAAIASAHLHPDRPI
jgi:hypothetical protein